MSPIDDPDDPADEFDQLTTKQQNIVDARANHPNAPNTEIADSADANPSYTSKVLDEYDHLVDHRRKTLDTDTSAEPASEPADPETTKERPHKATPDPDPTPDRHEQPTQPETTPTQINDNQSSSETIQINLTRSTAKEFLAKDTLSAQAKQDIVTQILDQAF